MPLQFQQGACLGQNCLLLANPAALGLPAASTWALTTNGVALVIDQVVDQGSTVGWAVQPPVAQIATTTPCAPTDFGPGDALTVTYNVAFDLMPDGQSVAVRPSTMGTFALSDGYPSTIINLASEQEGMNSSVTLMPDGTIQLLEFNGNDPGPQTWVAQPAPGGFRLLQPDLEYGVGADASGNLVLVAASEALVLQIVDGFQAGWVLLQTQTPYGPQSGPQYIYLPGPFNTQLVLSPAQSTFMPTNF